MVRPGFLLLVCSLLLPACGVPDAPNAIRMALASDPVTLDPRQATDAVSTRINRLLYRRLVEFDERSMPVPSLATWRRIADDHYRFTLGESGRSFSDGSRLTGWDVKATYDAILNPANASPHRLTLSMIERLEVPDGDTIDFFLSRPSPLFPAFVTIGIVPGTLIRNGHDFSRHPVGTGAFRLAEWPDEGRLVLERRTDGQMFEFVTVKDPTVRVLKLLRGEVDMLQNDLPPELIRFLRSKPDVLVQTGRGSNFSYLGFNLEDKSAGDLRIRRAIAHAIDRESIIRHLLAGGALVAQALLPPGHWAGAKSLAPYTHSVDEARRLLAEAGYTEDNPLRLVYKTSSDPFRVRLATIIQSQLARAGVEVEIRSFDWGTFYGDIKAGRFQMYSLAWVGIETPDIFRYVFHSGSIPPEGANRGRYTSVRADALIDRAESENTLEAQATHYRRLQSLLLEELPYVPLWYEDQFVAKRVDIRGYTLARDGNYDGLTATERISDREKKHAVGG